MMTMEGMRVLVAGGTGNVGRYLVRGVLAAGATVIVPSRSREKLGELERRIGREHRERFVPLVGDIADANDGERLAGTVERLDGVPIVRPVIHGILLIGRCRQT
jgi:NAD(P)-dependent dehydrogenase (short-subunit alcohol dehydrogenase family)